MTKANLSNKRRGRIIRYAPLVFWIGLIFYLSSDQGSMTETSRFIGPLLHFLFPNAPEESIQLYHGWIRKAAHISEYAILAFLAVRALARSSVMSLRTLKYIVPLVLVALIASIDEFNQSFQATRTGSFRDVLVDIIGGVTMVALLWLIKWPRPGNAHARVAEARTK